MPVILFPYDKTALKKSILNRREAEQMIDLMLVRPSDPAERSFRAGICGSPLQPPALSYCSTLWLTKCRSTVKPLCCGACFPSVTHKAGLHLACASLSPTQPDETKKKSCKVQIVKCWRTKYSDVFYLCIKRQTLNPVQRGLILGFRTHRQ